MTEDTKKALEAIKPVAKILCIDVMAEGEKLYCNGQKIGIACNSTLATVLEFIGYAFITVYCKNRFCKVTKNIRSAVERYWYK